MFIMFMYFPSSQNSCMWAKLISWIHGQSAAQNCTRGILISCFLGDETPYEVGCFYLKDEIATRMRNTE